MDTNQHLSRRSVLRLLAVAPLAGGVAAWPGMAAARPLRTDGTRSGSAGPELEEKIRQIIGRLELNGRWSIKFASLDAEDLVCAINSAEPLNPASSAKVFIAGTAFDALGPDHRVRTRIYATGPVRHGVLDGDLVLVAGGDLLLGGRIQPDGTLWLQGPDHGYARGQDPKYVPIPGDPLRSIRLLAAQVAARGVRHVKGDVIVDTSLFGQEPSPAGGFPIVASPMMINDNVIDITTSPGRRAGSAARIELSPHTPYLRIVNRVRTIADDDTDNFEPLQLDGDVTNADGTHTATMTGTIRVSSPPLLYAYHLPDPGRFAEFALALALNDEGVHAHPAPQGADRPDVADRDRLLAELVSLPLADQVKPMLQVSSNPHTGVLPHVVGAIAGGDPDNAKAAYEKLRSDLFRAAGLDPYPPGSEDDYYSADFFVAFLDHLHDKPYIDTYLDVLADGKQGGPAAGHLHSKGGGATSTIDDRFTVHKALVGYLDLPDDRMLGFGILGALVTTPDEGDRIGKLAQDALWEIVTTVYEATA
jgi:serine-type D-Ala-D-Ala carboxypeptidase/endopeptidase (penicillin-binding protein 4)